MPGTRPSPAAAVELVEIAPGLWRWTAPHPDWEPGAERNSPADWERDVGCVLYETRRDAVFVDPLLPPNAEAAWRALDERARRSSRRVVVLTTVRWHRRSRDALVERYDAKTPSAQADLPEGVEPFRIRGAAEIIYWIPEHRALVPGDRLLGDRNGGLRICPESWLRYTAVSREELKDRLRPLLDLPVERVLVSHGEPVLEGGREALERALA